MPQSELVVARTKPQHAARHDKEHRNEGQQQRDLATRAEAVLDESIQGGHGGGDRGIIRAFCQLMCGEYKGNSVTDISTSIENHLVAFAAEESRLNGNVVAMKDYQNNIYQQIKASLQ